MQWSALPSSATSASSRTSSLTVALCYRGNNQPSKNESDAFLHFNTILNLKRSDSQGLPPPHSSPATPSPQIHHRPPSLAKIKHFDGPLYGRYRVSGWSIHPPPLPPPYNCLLRPREHCTLSRFNMLHPGGKVNVHSSLVSN
jgi:hypothetical protein